MYCFFVFVVIIQKEQDNQYNFGLSRWKEKKKMINVLFFCFRSENPETTIQSVQLWFIKNKQFIKLK